MIISKDVEINITSRYIAYYKNLGYNVKVGDRIKIKVCDLMKTSHQYVDVICDECNASGSTQYRRVIDKEKYLCNKCARHKTIKEKYGVDNIFQLQEIKNKIKETNNVKYGVDYPLQNDEIKLKIKETNNLKYGVDNVFQLQETKNKSRETCLNKYNKEYANQNFDIKNKIAETNLEKYGFNSPMKNQTIKEKSIETRKKYLIDYIMNSFKKENIISIDYDSKIYTLKCDCGEEHNYDIHSKLLLNRKYNSKTTLCTICNPINFKISDRENKLLKFIKENYDGEIIESDRKILNGKELDIYLPDLKLAFEFNGLYWHNELYKSKYYHLNKTESCLENGIKLIHIWEDDWNYKQEIIKSMILNKLGKTPNKIFARKCEIKEISDTKLVREFLDKNHIQGFVGTTIKLGLYYENELVSLLTLGKKRKFMNSKSKEGEYELLRFCNKLNTNVVGGSSKLFKYFIKNYTFTEITTYADRSHSQGNLYKILGFE